MAPAASPALTLVTGPLTWEDRYLFTAETADYDDPLDHRYDDAE